MIGSHKTLRFYADDTINSTSHLESRIAEQIRHLAKNTSILRRIPK